MIPLSVFIGCLLGDKYKIDKDIKQCMLYPNNLEVIYSIQKNFQTNKKKKKNEKIIFKKISFCIIDYSLYNYNCFTSN